MMDNTANRHIQNDPGQDPRISDRDESVAPGGVLSAETLEALAEGDEETFSRIYLHYRESIVDFLFFLVHNREDAEELSQDVFAALWKNRTNIRDIRNFKGYLYRAAKYAAFNLMDRQKVAKQYRKFKKSAAEEFGNDPYEIYRSEEMMVLIEISLANMPEQRRTIFRMSHDQGLSNAEIAQKLNITRKVVENQLYRAKQSLKELLVLFVFLFIAH